MAPIAYECGINNKSNNTIQIAENKPIPCQENSICLYCCCEPQQCCLLIQRSSTKHFWEAWYFWLGIGLLILLIISSVTSYVISNCRQNIETLTGRPSVENLQSSNAENEISIHVIPTTGALPVHRKLLLCAPDSSVSLMTPIVA